MKRRQLPVPSMVFLLSTILGAFLLRGTTAQTSLTPEMIPPRVMREFRGAWIATVGNIDWPSKPGLSAMEQKAELRKLMDEAVKLRLNALIFQVRPAADAFYKSSIEPWSFYLTGYMGKAPEPAYDPLQFAVDEAHARGLELHAWFNPYRAGFQGMKVTSSRHVTRVHPSWVRHYGSAVWLDPAEPAVQDYVVRVILDVVRRYDIDGVHLDDYFYPYPETNSAGQRLDFPDEVTWKRYLKRGGKLERGDWRRDQVNTLVQRLSREIHKQKSWVRFGISPFGIWRPGFPARIKGLDAYDGIYADARKWLMNGWVDYLAPQLYWPIDPPEQSYSALFTWWQKQSALNRPVWPGGAVTRIGRSFPADEIVRQIEISRQSTEPGYIHWNISSLVKNPGDLQAKLLRKVYAEPALVPAGARPGSEPGKPLLTLNKKSSNPVLRWSVPHGRSGAAFWLVQTKRGDQWQSQIISGRVESREFSARDLPDVIAISAVGHNRVLSPAAVMSLKATPARNTAASKSRPKPLADR